MRASSFNADWAFRPRTRSFIESPLLGEPWTPVTLPHDAMLTQDRAASAGPDCGYFPGGVWEYCKVFRAPHEVTEQHLVLEFEGVYRDAVVEVNGDVVARQAHGYSQFFVELDGRLEPGAENEIRVEATAGDDSRWYSGAGIYRPVTLLTSGLVHIAPARTRITTRDSASDHALVEITAVIENRSSRSRTVVATITLTGPAGTVVADVQLPVTVSPGEPADLTQRLAVEGPDLWSLDAPHLHQCRIALHDDDGGSLDEEWTTFGIRSLELDRRGLRINGEVVKLRGACVHHDNGVLGAATIRRADERRVELLKAAGFNALRSAHNPMSRAMLDACDRVGMLVMDEAFDTWTRPKRHRDHAKAFLATWEQDLVAMVRKDINHPSVILYSIGNEIPEIGTSGGRQWSRRLAERLRREDPTRFVTNGVNAALACPSELVTAMAGVAPDDLTADFGVNTVLAAMLAVQPAVMTSELVDERLREAFSTLDVAGYNYLHNRYELDGARHPHRVIVGTEEMPSAVSTTWRQIQQLDHVIGDFCWTGWDYLGEAGIGRISFDPADDGAILASYPFLTAGSGDLDITGHRLPMSYYREIVYGLRQAPYLVVQDPRSYGVAPRHRSPWSWTDSVPSWTWTGREGDPTRVTVYSDADEVELILNGEPQGRTSVGSERHCVAETTVAYRPGELVAVAYKRGQEAGRSALRTASGVRALELHADRTVLRADHTDLAFVTVSLADDAGTPVPAARSVSLVVAGAGALQGFGSGNPSPSERFDSATCTTHCGRALAVVRPSGAGDISVTATAEGCDSVTVRLRAE